ncbi:MAG TPA: hypothetical protein VEC06_08570 [Paucimonas sp.]|nr:hypothetical protein [Paucimonas sp.]
MPFTFTINGHTYTSDPANVSVPDGYRFIKYGYITALANLAQDIVAVMTQAIADTTASAAAAAASAATAAAAPGTSATSTTSLSIGTGTKTLTIQTGKSIAVGAKMLVARTSDVTKWMLGSVVSYNSSTGELVLTVGTGDTSGSGTYTDWTVSLSGPMGTSTKIQNVVTGTSNINLTSTPTFAILTPTAYGAWFKLPDATGCGVSGTPLHALKNNSVYPARVLNDSGTLLGFVPPKTTLYASCENNGSAAGVWDIPGIELYGAAAQLLTANLRSNVKVTALNANEDVIFGTNSSGHLYATVYNKSTNQWGAVTAIRAANIGANYGVCTCAADKVLVVSATTSTTNFESVVITIAGGSVSAVGTPEPKTLSANISNFVAGSELQEINGAYVTSYITATPTLELRSIAVSGTTPAASNATTLSGTAGGHVSGSGTVAVVASYESGSVHVKPYTISGSTAPAVGTGVTDTVTGAGTIRHFSKMSSGRWAIVYDDNSQLIGGFASLTGTTVATSIVTIFGTPNFSDAIQVGANKLLVTTSDNSQPCYNLVNDNGSGTASPGTAIDVEAAGLSRHCLYVDGTNVCVYAASSNTQYVNVINCSGASPVLSRTTGNMNFTAGYIPTWSLADTIGRRNPLGLYGTKAAYRMPSNSSPINIKIVDGVPLTEARNGFFGTSNHRGSAANTAWITDQSTMITKMECVA